MLTHRVDGEGAPLVLTPLVLLNGGMMSIGAWQPFVAPLSARYHIIRCDFRGQLLTPGPFARSFEEHALDVVEVLDELGIERAHVLGVSYGGEVAMTLAALHPSRVERLTVISATDYTADWMRRDAVEGRELAERAARGEGTGGELFRRVAAATWSEAWLAKQPPDFLEQRARQVSALPPAYFEGMAALLGLLETLDLRPLLPRITAPALVLAGANDRIFPLEHMRAIAAAIPGAQLEVVPDTGHGLLMERADRVLAALLG
jgi:3-oxoadipate enol-lactonase